MTLNRSQHSGPQPVALRLLQHNISQLGAPMLDPTVLANGVALSGVMASSDGLVNGPGVPQLVAKESPPTFLQQKCKNEVVSTAENSTCLKGLPGGILQ